jgi:hypothetical protein
MDEPLQRARPALSTRLAERMSTPIVLAAIVLVMYGASAVASLRADGGLGRINMGPVWAVQRGESEAIDQAVRAGPRGTGYDGQFFYFIALDPVHAHAYVDDASYRYTRIAYPMTARLAALGEADRIPAALILVNVAAAAIATFCLASLFARKRFPTWPALLFALYPGLLYAFAKDTSEVLAYSAVVAAIYVLDSRATWAATAGSGLLFGYAGLTRETAALFSVGCVIALVADGRRAALGRAAVLTVLALAPLAAWKAFLSLWLGFSNQGIIDSLVPLHGIAEQWPWSVNETNVALAVILPALISALFGASLLARGIDVRYPTILLANAALLLVLKAEAFAGYESTSRVATGSALAAILALPLVASHLSRTRAVVLAGMWSIPWSFASAIIVLSVANALD